MTPRQQATELRLKLEPVRGVDGKPIAGGWHVLCRTGAMLYPYDRKTWCADQLNTYWHNRLLRDYPGQMTEFGEAAELAGSYDAADEYTLHFPAELLDEVAKTLKARRRRRVSAESRERARQTMLRLRAEGRMGSLNSGPVTLYDGKGRFLNRDFRF